MSKTNRELATMLLRFRKYRKFRNRMYRRHTRFWRGYNNRYGNVLKKHHKIDSNDKDI